MWPGSEKSQPCNSDWQKLKAENTELLKESREMDWPTILNSFGKKGNKWIDKKSESEVLQAVAVDLYLFPIPFIDQKPHSDCPSQSYLLSIFQPKIVWVLNYQIAVAFEIIRREKLCFCPMRRPTLNPPS